MLYKSIPTWYQSHRRRKSSLKDEFLTQSAPDIHKKLQNLVAEGSRELHQSVCIATSVYNNRDLGKEKKDLEKEKRKGQTTGGSDCRTQRGFPRAKSKPKNMLSMWTGRPF
jgi:hypothetical protein